MVLQEILMAVPAPVTPDSGLTTGIVDLLWKGAIGFVAALLLYVIRDRRRTKLENDLTEKTQEPKAKKIGLETLELQIVAMSSAWNHERESKDRQIQELEESLSEERKEHRKTKVKLEDACTKLETAQDRIASLESQMSLIEGELGELVRTRRGKSARTRKGDPQ
jgi:chromosome segregation ATPase